jgi:oxygen-independent coproporphyrinogen-3 oxidase
VRHKKPENWLAAVADYGHGIAEERPLGLCEQASEALLMGLRLSEGIDLVLLSRRFGIPAGELIENERLAFHGSLGLVRQEGSRVVVTDAGMPLLDALLGELVPAGLVEA